MLKTIVTTCLKYEYLIENFTKLYDKFCGEEFTVDVAKDKEKKSDQLLRILDGLKDKYYKNQYFILLEDDFFLLREVDMCAFDEIWQYLCQKDFDRFSLQSRNQYLNKNWNLYSEKLPSRNIFRADDKVKCLFSLEASIWNKHFLRNYLERGLSDQEIEVKMSDKIRGTHYTILALDKPVMTYKDACVGGQQRIKIENGKIYLLIEGGDGKDKWEYQNIQI